MAHAYGNRPKGRLSLWRSLYILYGWYTYLKLWDQSYKGTVSSKEGYSLTYDLDFRVSILSKYNDGIKRYNLFWKFGQQLYRLNWLHFMKFNFFSKIHFFLQCLRPSEFFNLSAGKNLKDPWKISKFGVPLFSIALLNCVRTSSTGKPVILARILKWNSNEHLRRQECKIFCLPVLELLVTSQNNHKKGLQGPSLTAMSHNGTEQQYFCPRYSTLRKVELEIINI